MGSSMAVPKRKSSPNGSWTMASKLYFSPTFTCCGNLISTWGGLLPAVN
jgi:hypothetical protein